MENTKWYVVIALDLLTFLVVVGVHAPALGQEAPPIPLSVAFDELGEPVAMRVRGVGVAIRGGDRRFRLICTSALQLSSKSTLEVGTRPGGLWLGHFRGIEHTGPTGCDRGSAADLEDAFVLDADDGGETVHLLVGGSGRSSVLRSTDGGDRFEVAFDLPEGPVYFSLRLAPSDPDRIYLTGVVSDADAGTTSSFLYRSEDRGATFESTPFEFDGSKIGRLVAVDAQVPTRLYVVLTRGLISHSHGEEIHERDRVLVSDDGGDTFRELATPRLFGGLVVGDEPGEVWLGDAEGGLQHSANGGESFSMLDEDLHVSCLARQGGRLWVCADSTRDPFSLGYTDDRGQSFVASMRLEEVPGILPCDPDAPARCDIAWRAFLFWHGPDASSDAGVATPDAAMPGAATASGAASDAGRDSVVAPKAVAGRDAGGALAQSTSEGSGCSCSTTMAGDLPGAIPTVLALWWLTRRRRGDPRRAA